MAIQVTGSIAVALVVIARELCAKCAAKKGGGGIEATGESPILSAWFLHVDPTSPLGVEPIAEKGESGSDGLANPLWKMREARADRGAAATKLNAETGATSVAASAATKPTAETGAASGR